MESRSSIKKNALLNIIYKLSSMIFPLIVYPYVSRILLAENLGKVAFFSNVTSYGLLFGSIGISTYGIRAIAKVRDNKEKLSKTVKELFLINSIITVLVLVFLGVSLIWVDKFKSNRYLLFISMAQIAIAPLSMEWLYGGLEEYSYITKRAIIFKVISLFLIFGFVRTQEDYIKYALILGLSSVGNYICNFAFSRKFIYFRCSEKLEFVKHLKPSLTLFASLLAISVYTSLDSVMLGFINGDNAVGLYDMAVKAKTVTLSLINSISGVLLPRLSYYVAQNAKNQYNEMLKKSIRIIFMIAVPLTVLFEIEARDIIIILGGSEYIGAVSCMRIIMPILLISGFSNITGNQILIPHGLDKYYTKAVVCGAVIDVILNGLLMPRYSIYGAALATVIAEVVQMLVQSYYSRSYLKKRLDITCMKRIVLSTLIAGTMVCISRYIFSFHPFINILLYTFVFLGIYVVFIYAFYGKKESMKFFL
ncbi:flippase [Blautia sp. MSJ-9]|uniref:flippase n=1 Tax=Blautia sp. MSJ-9 TaxID=2841511 RepID=UPI001C11D5BA|nr:flippase [Blautia sp. MSJ-9]MBU5680978.1 flippase [Blautia sp. MSJ-9]